MFMCRWPNGDLSFVHTPSKEEAIIALDEWDNTELAEITRVSDFMVDVSFRQACTDQKQYPCVTQSCQSSIAWLAMITRDELLYQAADETPRCVIVRMPTPPSAGTLLARMRHRATQLAHS
jgi:hypothetical protein